MTRFNRKERKNNQQWVPVSPKQPQTIAAPLIDASPISPQPPIPRQTPSHHPRFFSAIPLLPLTKVATDKLASIHSADLLHIITLIDLKYDGGSANFLTYYQHDNEFTPSHYAAWKILLLRQDISIEEALCRMQDLSQKQASELAIQLINEQQKNHAWYRGF